MHEGKQYIVVAIGGNGREAAQGDGIHQRLMYGWGHVGLEGRRPAHGIGPRACARTRQHHAAASLFPGDYLKVIGHGFAADRDG